MDSMAMDRNVWCWIMSTSTVNQPTSTFFADSLKSLDFYFHRELLLMATRNPARKPVDMVSLSHYLRSGFFFAPSNRWLGVWDFWLPSTVFLIQLLVWFQLSLQTDLPCCLCGSSWNQGEVGGEMDGFSHLFGLSSHDLQKGQMWMWKLVKLYHG